jgi:hypothetical protein
MRHWITFYRPDSGQIVSSCVVTQGQEDQRCSSGDVGWIAGLWGGDEYRIDLTTGEPAPLFEFDPVIEPNLLGNLPVGTTALYLDHCDVIDDGELELDSGGFAIDVRVTLTKDLYRPLTVVVTCEA